MCNIRCTPCPVIVDIMCVFFKETLAFKTLLLCVTCAAVKEELAVSSYCLGTDRRSLIPMPYICTRTDSQRTILFFILWPFVYSSTSMKDLYSETTLAFKQSERGIQGKEPLFCFDCNSTKNSSTN